LVEGTAVTVSNITTAKLTIRTNRVDRLRREDVMSVAAADSFSGGCAARRDHYVDSARPPNARLVRMLVMSFVLVAVQLPQQPAHAAAIIRIPTGSLPAV